MGELSLDGLLLAVVGGMLLILLFAFLRRSPKVAMVAWLIGIFFIPVWIGQTVFAYFPAFVIVGLLATLSLLPTPLAIRPTVADVVLLGVVVAVVSLYALKLTTRSATFDLLVVWGVAYALGRLIVHVVDQAWIYGAFGVFGAAASVVALVEFATGRNLFITFLGNNSATFARWGSLQARGDVIRAEGAFGHAIALGITLAVAACLVLGSRFRPALKTALAGLCLAGVVVSFSRSAMLTALVSIVLVCLFLRGPLSRTYRVVVLVLLSATAALAAGPIIGVFDTSNEAEGSALYRADLLQLVRTMKPLGLSGSFSVSTTSEVSVGEFGSVDNALLLIGLIFGWVVLGVVLLVAIGGVVTILRGRASIATIVAVAQIPALLTVAFITQYAAVAWFTVGLAVGSQALKSATARPGPGADLDHHVPVAREERAHA
ncbi:hypothetical protein SAMN04488544_3963 [Microlunatus sagamiharensis]|uniref:O-antigen ligase like membrane protein n=1 Tax=Microlunatus sagamiharensis TaxID=546874 RepID=A0A1H2NGP7_9ACTN|nr:hypothetical protein [Microlunatus sagamiharensis]SDV04371.1 hypothetical protein SAMN04488544_3963 [Microlunatus sagamiharensis]